MQRNQAADKVCFQSGHDFQSYPEGKPIGDPVTKQLYQEKVTRCRLCGMTPEHVFRYQMAPKGKAKDHARSSGGAAASPSPED